jgi:hypothetical protein
MDILEKVQQMLADGTYPKPEPTPYSDQAFALLKTELPFPEKLKQIRELQKLASAAAGEDASRFGWVVESIYADATEEQIKLMFEDAE